MHFRTSREPSSRSPTLGADQIRRQKRQNDTSRSSYPESDRRDVRHCLRCSKRLCNFSILRQVEIDGMRTETSRELQTWQERNGQRQKRNRAHSKPRNDFRSDQKIRQLLVWGRTLGPRRPTGRDAILYLAKPCANQVESGFPTYNQGTLSAGPSSPSAT